MRLRLLLIVFVMFSCSSVKKINRKDKCEAAYYLRKGYLGF